MLTEILNKTSQIAGGENGWASLRGYNKSPSRKAFFADEVIKLTELGGLSWLVSGSKDIVLAITDGWILAITRHTQAGGRYIGGTVSSYHLVMFKDSREVLSLEDRCDDNDYTSNYPRLPVMDIYDVAITGKVRRPRTAHVCGASGFGQSLSDTCPACEGQ